MVIFQFAMLNYQRVSTKLTMDNDTLGNHLMHRHVKTSTIAISAGHGWQLQCLGQFAAKWWCIVQVMYC